MSVSNCGSGVVCLELTAQQTEQLVPLVQQVAAESKNVLFFAVAVPFWRNDATVWELQTTVIPAHIGQKIVKLVNSRKGEA